MRLTDHGCTTPIYLLVGAALLLASLTLAIKTAVQGGLEILLIYRGIFSSW